MDRPQITYPVAFAPTGFVSAEQGSDDDVGSSIATVVLWPLGTRPLNPDFGMPDESFLAGGADLEEIRAAIVANEPRAASLEIVQDDAQLANFLSSVRIGFRSEDVPAP